MQFTWKAYEKLIRLLRENDYAITDYSEYKNLEGKPCAILRHDIDNSISKAFEMAKLENSLGVMSTYFVLLTSEFYNPAAAANTKMLKQMYQMGHSIGLHFDEVSYKGMEESKIKEQAEKERKILEGILEIPVRTVSMHRPSKGTLEADWKFPNMINSYGVEFFKDFKYVSDSRMHWREDVEAIIKSHEYDNLHILTHAFWYEERAKGTKQKLEDFIHAAVTERYDILNRNFRDLSEFVLKGEIQV